MAMMTAGSQVVRLAHWAPQRGLAVRSGSKLFPQKFDNFHGGKISVTAKNYKPLWFEVEEVAPNGRVLKRTTGMDYLLLDAVSKSLNFTYNNLHVDSWAEALDLTSQRISFVTPVYHAVLVTRLKRFDYSLGYTFAFISFSMKKPEIQPQWQSLYYPLADQVWLAILMIVILAPGFFLIATQVARTEAGLLDDRDVMTLRNGFTLMFGSLLGQSVEMGKTSKNGIRMLVGGWLIFAFIIGTAYRGNLTAALTLPKYPPRPETIEQLVGNAKMVTIMPWGKDFKSYFKDSDSPVFEKLSDLMLVGIDTIEGLQQAIDSRQAHMETIHKLKLDIAEQFTRLDGSTQLYIGRENVMPGLAAWPLPHDAPYTANINRCLHAVIEASD
ncbi:ionotropic receptor 21a-like [Penaeus indicus]|uniref:ionotropic receptor 21a-like n=1 Tax=Penaeus indicus TaxID=29960 RepID=UPI00300D3818